jgi:hypothetical protein
MMMKSMFEYTGFPEDRELLMVIDAASQRLFEELHGLDIDSLEISDYNKRYFGAKLASLSPILKKNSYILSWSLAEADVSLDEFVLLDYGGGSGTLSLLAKESGLGTVIYNDIYDVSCRDAKRIAGAIGDEADHYVHGDIDDVLDFLTANNINCDAVASVDVIEC